MKEISARKTSGAVISCNVSHKKSIDAPTLVGILSGKIPVAPWQSHIETFFNELPEDSILGVMAENNLSLQHLTTVFLTIHPAFQGKNFKKFLHAKE